MASSLCRFPAPSFRYSDARESGKPGPQRPFRMPPPAGTNASHQARLDPRSTQIQMLLPWLCWSPFPCLRAERKQVSDEEGNWESGNLTRAFQESWFSA